MKVVVLVVVVMMAMPSIGPEAGFGEPSCPLGSFWYVPRADPT
jgi:hypothetical protein